MAERLDLPRLHQCLDGLSAALTQLDEGDASAAASVRRLTRLVASMGGAPPGLRESARVVADGPDRLLADGAGTVCRNLQAILDRIEGAGGTVHVMLVEGDPVLGARLSRELTEDGFRVRWIPRGDAVLGSLEAASVDLLVVDLILPDQDGRDLIVELSQNSEFQRLPLVALGPDGEAFALARTESLALGADVFLPRTALGDRILNELHRLSGGGEALSTDGGVPVLRRGPFTTRFNSRPEPGGSVVLLSFDGFRKLADEEGADEGFAALGSIAGALATEVSGLSAICRWGLTQLALSLESVDPGAAAERVETAVEALRAQGDLGKAARRLLDEVSGASVPAPTHRTLDQIMLVAGEARLLPGGEGTHLKLSKGPKPKPTEHPTPRSDRAMPDDDRRPVILLIEDDPVTTALVRHKLGQLNFTTRHFGNGDDALAALPGLTFDLAILDLNLPGVDGFQLVKAIRAAEAGGGPRRPIVILSGMTGEEGIVRGLELGADDYVLKPFSPLELTARVRRLLAPLTEVR